MTTITAQGAEEPEDRAKALADIADALARLGLTADPVDEQLSALRNEIASLRAKLEHGCCGHHACWHVYPMSTGYAGGGWGGSYTIANGVANNTTALPYNLTTTNAAAGAATYTGTLTYNI